jgi:hypothetical protein
MNLERHAPRDFIAELGWGNAFNPSAVHTSPSAPSGTGRIVDPSPQNIASGSSYLPANRIVVKVSLGWDRTI